MCPHCRQAVIIVELRGVEVDHCLTCGGTWLDRGELELVVELAGGSPDPLVAELERSNGGTKSARRCLRCQRKMELALVGPSPAVEIDRCRHGHGIWLDAGELAALVRGCAKTPDAALAAFLGDLFGQAAGGAAKES